MIDKLIGFSISNKLIVGLLTAALIGWGIYSLRQIPIDAVPDITNNQVQIITNSPTLAAQEVEQFVTFPIEIAMSNLPDIVETRSISRFGISVITIVFKEHLDIYHARQLISEQLQIARAEIPESFGKPKLAPITTGLGEVYQYIVHTTEGYEDKYTASDLRTIHDWIVKRQLAGTPGVIEVSGWGGQLKQYEVAINPEKLKSMDISVGEVFNALKVNNENTGGSYIEKRYSTYFIRGEGLVKTLEDIKKIVVKTVNETPILVRDLAKVQFGTAPRYGALTHNAKGEVVGGQALMLKGENSHRVVDAVKKRMETIQKSLPKGVIVEAFIDRSELIDRAIHTVSKNLIEGGLIVILILVLLLGNLRGGLIVASVIPLSMLFAVSLMNLFGVSANLMSLGAIDFGLIVDGAVIIVEGIVYRVYSKNQEKNLSQKEMDKNVLDASVRIRKSAAFGEIIILIVYLPILTLVGIEGKMFKPMAQTVAFAILGALVLSFTYVPMMSALFLDKKITNKVTIADKIIGQLTRIYKPILLKALNHKTPIIVVSVIIFIFTLLSFRKLGGEFIPTLDEGDFALHQILPPGSSLAQSIEVSGKIQKLLLDKFPEVKMIVTKMGTSEIPTDPMPIEVGDIMVKMKPKKEWTSAQSKQEMFDKMEEVLSVIPGVSYEFTQPIQMRFNELMSGVRQDIAIKIYGENTEILFLKAKEAEKIIKGIKGVGDLRVEQITGLPQMIVRYQRNKLAQYGLNISDLNTLVRTAFAGEKTGVVFEGEKQFDLVVRFEKRFRENIDHLKNLYVSLPNGQQVPLKEVATIQFEEGPMQISRENAKRRIVIGINARNRDTESLVTEIKEKLDNELNLPAGYFTSYGGQFENLVKAKERLAIAVPLALILIFVLLYLTFNSVKQALLIFTAIPLAAIGGIWSLWLRDMPFSISAGIGFIALFGVAVLNGIVLIAQFNELKKQGIKNISRRALSGSLTRLRPVVITASVAAFGFLPMALSKTAGAEVQRPLATVVIGGLITASLLTLIVLPILYAVFEKINIRKKTGLLTIFVLVFSLGGNKVNAQTPDTLYLNLSEAINLALVNYPAIKATQLNTEKEQTLLPNAFNLGKTNVFYGRDETSQGRASGVESFGITQQFEFPTIYFKRKDVQNQKVQLSSAAEIVSQNELKKKVRLGYSNLIYHHNMVDLHEELIVYFKYLTKAAQSKFETGEGTYVDKIAGEAKYWDAYSKLQRVRANKEVAMINLQSWVYTKSTISIKDRNLSWTDSLSTKNIEWEQNPSLNYYNQITKLSEANYQLQKNDWLPDFSFSYKSQQVNNIPGFYGYQLGILLPLWFPGEQAKIKSQKLETERIKSLLDESKLEIETSFQQKLIEFQNLKEEIKTYKTHQLPLANQLIKLAAKGFKEGEFGYLEYTQYINEAIGIKEVYLNKELLLNHIGIELHFLSGQ